MIAIEPSLLCTLVLAGVTTYCVIRVLQAAENIFCWFATRKDDDGSAS